MVDVPFCEGSKRVGNETRCVVEDRRAGYVVDAQAYGERTLAGEEFLRPSLSTTKSQVIGGDSPGKPNASSAVAHIPAASAAYSYVTWALVLVHSNSWYRRTLMNTTVVLFSSRKGSDSGDQTP